MFQIILKTPGAQGQKINLPDGAFMVGADTGNHLCLNAPGVSRVHCRLTVRGTKLFVQDLNSSNGTFCNQNPVSSQEPVQVPPGAVLLIGSVQIEAVGTEKTEAPAAPKTPAPEPVLNEEERRLAASVQQAKNSSEPDSVPVLAVSGIPAAARPMVQEIKKQAHAELLNRLNLKRLAMGEVTEEHLEEKAKKVIHEILLDLSIPLPPGVTREKIEKELYYEAIGLGPLETLIAMSTITEIMVNGPDHIYVEHKGVLYRTDMAFADNSQVMAAIERIVSPLGRRIDESSPMVDARLKDGSRVNAIIPPLS